MEMVQLAESIGIRLEPLTLTPQLLYWREITVVNDVEMRWDSDGSVPFVVTGGYGLALAARNKLGVRLAARAVPLVNIALIVWDAVTLVGAVQSVSRTNVNYSTYPAGTREPLSSDIGPVIR